MGTVIGKGDNIKSKLFNGITVIESLKISAKRSKIAYIDSGYNDSKVGGRGLVTMLELDHTVR